MSTKIYQSIFIEAEIKGPERKGFLRLIKSDHGRIDGNNLAEKLSEVCNRLNDEGYEILSVTPVTNTVREASGPFSLTKTDGVIVTAKKLRIE